jgi:hypothetical protein
MNKQFFEKVLPTQGNICVVGIKDKSVKPRFVDDIDSAIEQMVAFDKDNYNTFFALGTFEGYERKAAGCIFMRAFFVDLDCGEGKPYAEWEDGLIALHKFVDNTDLPTPIIVNSGRGIHAYWPFDDEVPAEDWKPYAEKFKAFCLNNGLQIDETVTADLARVLRVPGSRNLKGEPLPVEVIQDTEPTSFEYWTERLGAVVLPFDLKKVEKGLDPDTKAIYERRNDNFEYDFMRIAQMSLEGNGCGQIKYILENAASCPEPIWYAGISVASRCHDGSTAIHIMSEDHPKYSWEETERKSAQSLEVDWSFSCEAFERANAGGCKGCPYAGKFGKRGPIELGKILRTAQQPTDREPDEQQTNTQESIRVETNTEKIPFFPDALYPFSRGINGGIYFQPSPRATKKGMVQDPPEMISAVDFFPTQRVFSPHDGECLVMRAVLPIDPTREFLLPLKDVGAVDRLKSALLFQGINFDQRHAPMVSSYITKWMDFLMQTQRASIMRMQQGWTENNESFVLGTTEYMVDGEERYCPPSPMAKNVVKNIQEQGSFDEWKKAIQMFNDPGYEYHAFAVLCGLASPLMQFTNVNGAIYSLFGEAGNGKTGALNGALSIWGNCENLAVFDATQNALMQRMITCKNILFGMDEQSNTDGKVVSHVAYNVSSGAPKLRLQASVNQEREMSFVTNLLAIITTNTPLKDIIALYKANTNPEDVRIIEPEVPRPSEPGYELNMARGLLMFEPLKFNYGFAGPVYVKDLYQQKLTEVKKRIRNEYLDYSRAYTDNAEYRFIANVLAVTRVAGEDGNRLGLFNFDLDRIIGVVGQGIMDTINGKSKDKTSAYEDILGDFINKYIQCALVIKDGRTSTEPKQALYIRAEVDEGKIYISTSAMKTYLKDIKLGVREFESNLTRRGTLKSKIRKQMASGWKDAFGTTNIQAYEIEMDMTHLFPLNEEAVVSE